jgi:L-rhamnose isomerase
LQDNGKFTALMVAQEELKTMPFGDVWNEYCRVCGKPADGEWFPKVTEYEEKVLVNRK